MNKLALGIAAVGIASLLSIPAHATSKQNHTCQGGHNCNGGVSDISTNNTNVNTNVGVNLNSNINRNNATSSSTSNATSKSNSNSRSVSGSISSTNNSVSTSANGGSANAVGGSASTGDVNVHNNYDAPVSSAYAPPLTSSNDTCMGSSSGGAQAAGFGVSVGKTYTDGDCVLRKDARFMHNAGHKDIALAMMCEKKTVRRAVAQTGTAEQKRICGITEADTTAAENVPPKRKRPDRGDFDGLN